VILLGSYIESNLLQIARALPFINFEQPILSATQNDMWEFVNGVPRFTDRYVEIRLLANYFQSSEQKQALTRPRHLNHPVRAYVVSTDDLSQYEFIASEDCSLDAGRGLELFPKPSSGGRPALVRKRLFQIMDQSLRNDGYFHIPTIRQQMRQLGHSYGAIKRGIDMYIQIKNLVRNGNCVHS
jgi:hypothetical protein